MLIVQIAQQKQVSIRQFLCAGDPTIRVYHKTLGYSTFPGSQCWQHCNVNVFSTVNMYIFAVNVHLYLLYICILFYLLNIFHSCVILNNTAAGTTFRMNKVSIYLEVSSLEFQSLK